MPAKHRDICFWDQHSKFQGCFPLKCLKGSVAYFNTRKGAWEWPQCDAESRVHLTDVDSYARRQRYSLIIYNCFKIEWWAPYCWHQPGAFDYTQERRQCRCRQRMWTAVNRTIINLAVSYICANCIAIACITEPYLVPPPKSRFRGLRGSCF